MTASRIQGFGMLWLGLALLYFAASSMGHRPAALAVLGLMLGVAIAASGPRFTGLAAAVALAGAGWIFAESLHALAYLPPLAAFAFMAWFFGRTLRAGSEPLITRIARREHPDLPADMACHARRLTVLWTACFASLLAVGLALAPLVPFDAWSRWVQALGYFVPAALFFGEYAYRRQRFVHRTHGSLAVLVPNVLAVIRETALERVGRAAQGGETR